VFGKSRIKGKLEWDPLEN